MKRFLGHNRRLYMPCHLHFSQLRFIVRVVDGVCYYFSAYQEVFRMHCSERYIVVNIIFRVLHSNMENLNTSEFRKSLSPLSYKIMYVYNIHVIF